MNYLQALAAQVREMVDPSLVPDDSNDLFLIYAVLVRTKGMQVSREDVHDAWAAWMTLSGHPDHKAIRPYEQLTEQVRAEDDPFVKAIRAAAAEVE